MTRCAALGLVILSMLACAAALEPSDASARGACPNERSTFTTATPALRASVLCLVNETRLQRGLPALHRDDRLESAAQLHADDQVARSYYGHVSPPPNSTTFDQRIRAAGYLFDAAAESIAIGSSTPLDVVDLWLVDKDVMPPGHCRNILDPAMRDLGVGISSGVAFAPYSGVWTKEFGRLQNIPAPSTNTAPFNACPDALSLITGGPTPTATTTAATAITASSATVNGTANANGGGFTSYHVEYGKTSAYGGQTLERVAGTSGVTVTEALPGLSAGTYHFQVVACNQNGETRSIDRVFTMTGSAARPLVSTGAATAVTQTTATLNGSVNPAGRATTYGFEYGPTTGYGFSTTSVTAGSDTIEQGVSMAIIGLTPGTFYHARMVATNSDGTTFGTDASFMTLAPPVVVTGSVAPVGTTATLTGSVNPRGQATTYRFEYGATTSYGTSTAPTSAGSGTAAQAVSALAGGLSAGATYHFRIVATNADGTATGADASFTTLDPPTVVTGAATAGQTTATLNATVDPNAKTTTYRFEYGLTTSYGTSTSNVSTAAGSTPVSVVAMVGGLTRGTTYHFRIVATTADGSASGSDVAFTTLDPPAVLTGTATAGQTTATIDGSVDPNGRTTTYHFEYGTTTAYGSSTAAVAAGSGSAAVAVISALSGLTAGSTYHYRVVATSADGTDSGSDGAFTTLDPPSAATGSAVAGQTTATLNGSVDPNGAATTYRFDYGTSTAYGQTSAATSAGAGEAAQVVSTAVSGLTAGTSYHARIVATSVDGTTNGTDTAFTTTGAPTPPPPPLAPPATVTGSVTGIGTTTATLNGSVNPRGKATTYRFVRGTTTAYGTSTAAASAGSGSGPQAVRASLTGLTARTAYHVRLVAANSDGTTNGLDVVFTTASTPPPRPPPLPPAVVVTGLKVSPSKFRAARSGASVATAAVRDHGRARVRYTLSSAAGVRFTVQRSSEGRRMDGRCVKSTRSNSRRSRCTRYVRVSGSFARSRGAGTDRFIFAGRMGGRALRPGRYRLRVTPGAGRTVRATFRVMR